MLGRDVLSARRRRRSISYLPEASLVFAASTTPHSAADKLRINTLIADIKTTPGLWDILDGLIVPQHAAQASQLNIKNPAQYALTPVNNPTHTPYVGFTYNGSNNYHNTGFDPATAGGAFSQNSAHLGIHSFTTANNEIKYQAGQHNGTTSGTQIGNAILSSHNGGGYYAVNGGNVTFTGSVLGEFGSAAHFIANRVSSSAVQMFRNGVQIHTAASTSSPVVSQPLYFGSTRYGAANFSATLQTLSVLHWGGGLSPTQAAALSAAIAKYLFSATIASGFDVFLVAGQSNTYAGSPFDPTQDGADYRIWQWSRSLGRPALGMDFLEHFDTSLAVGRIGFATKFAKLYIAGGRLAAGRRILLIPCGFSGTGFATGHWPVTTGTLWAQAVQNANAAMALPGAEFKGILWHQGEADAIAAGSQWRTNYRANLDAALGGFRASITGAANAPIVVGGMSNDWIGADADRQSIQASIADTPNRLSRCGFASSVSPTVLAGAAGDLVHFPAASQRALGQRYFDAFTPL